MGRGRGRGRSVGVARGGSVGVGRGGGRVGNKRDKTKEIQRIDSSESGDKVPTDSRECKDKLPEGIYLMNGAGSDIGVSTSRLVGRKRKAEEIETNQSSDDETWDCLATDSPECRDKPPTTSYIVTRYSGALEGTSHMPQEQFTAWMQELEDFENNSPGLEDPNFQKMQSDSMCHDFFSIIQIKRPEMAEYVLLEPRSLQGVLGWGCFLHMNFIAKHKDEDDCSGVLFFAELDLTRSGVTCLTELGGHSSCWY